MMKSIFICCLLFVAHSISVAQNRYETREEKLEQLKTRTDITVTEIQKDILRLEYPNGKVIYKNIADYQYPESSIQKPVYSPTYDSTIIDLTTIDTTLYYQKYQFWQEVPLGNYPILLVGDLNNNRLPELYGQIKDYTSDYSDITVYEENEQGGFDSVYRYDTTVVAEAIYDVDKSGENNFRILRNYLDTTTNNGWKQYLFFKKPSDASLATELSFIFQPVMNNNSQQNDVYFGDWDGDLLTDQIFIIPCCPGNIFVYEYNPSIPDFDSVYQYDYTPLDLYYGGFAIDDFDEDTKTEFFSGSIHGKVLSIENNGNNSYAPNLEGMVETYNAYLLAETDDIDKNGKKEIWVGGDAFYPNIGAITRITIFESDGNNSYQVVGRIDLLGVFSFYASNLQVLDVDKDGTDDIMVCIDQTVLILKFNGSPNHQTYELFYVKINDYENNYIGYYGSNMYNLTGDDREELLINCWDDPPGLGTIKWFNYLFKPNFTVDVKDPKAISPTNFNISPNYPNPFNPSTELEIDIPEYSNVSLKVYDFLGKEITTLLNKELSPGNYKINWEAKDSNGKLLPSGVYLIRMVTDKYIKTIKALLLK